ncbi:dienelactone hydrolase family protein [Kamptonema formosum]|uniref:dienelactone hydrolase family protein n=1 Tax=Kamptonema formosum TaxID=331992 RepID=UPI000349876E|nr:dienelactone hydrolase family protein [Oscillatoria sp. PCC 10802]
MLNQKIAVASADGGSFSAYVAIPAAGQGAGVLVIQEVFGINEVMRQIANSYAEAGYVAIVPDLFWRQEPNVELTDRTEAEWDRAIELYQGFDEDRGVEDLMATLSALREMPACTGRVGTVGFCLGGKLAYLMATRSDADCNVSYYGVAIENNLAEAGNIKKPLMLHIAEKDRFVPPEAQATIRAALSGNPLVTVYSYPGADHAFARVGGVPYSEGAAQVANSRTLEFFQQHLGLSGV